jgi:hypothetical protein
MLSQQVSQFSPDLCTSAHVSNRCLSKLYGPCILELYETTDDLSLLASAIRRWDLEAYQCPVLKLTALCYFSPVNVHGELFARTR